MVQANGVHPADPAAVIEFLQNTLPFNELDEPVLQQVAECCAIDFFPKGTLVLQQDISEVNCLYLIHRGGVKVYLTDSDHQVTLKDYRGEGGYFGALGLIRGSKANLNVETVEDTFCFLLEKEMFLELVRNTPRVAQYYLEKFSEDVVSTAYTELRSERTRARTESAFYLFSVEVQNVIKRELAIISGDQSIQEAATKMAELQVGSILVVGPEGGIVGIVTDKDMRSKVVAVGLDCRAGVEKIMTFPVHTISAHAVCFDALLQMMNLQVHHLAVERQKQIIGVVTAHDIMVHQGTSPLYLFREIGAQRRIEGLYSLAEKVPRVVRTLIEEGAKANNITRMISVINDQIVSRILMLLHEQMGPAPQPFCWLMMGSEGRKEQTFKTDQDNALVYETPSEDWEQIKTAKLYFRRFGNQAIKHLEACGYPLCNGEMMASNPKWRKPYSVWRAYFSRWMNAPEPNEVMHAAIFFDFRAGYGHMELGERLRTHLCVTAPQKPIFLMHLAKECLKNKPPLSFFRHFIVEKNGEHRNRLDLKKRGIVPFVDFARVLALRHGLRQTNTLSRLQALVDGEHIPRALYLEAREAYEFQMQMRLVHQMQMIESGQKPHNFIDPADLSELEKQTLKEAFAVIGRLQTYVKDEFRVMTTD